MGKRELKALRYDPVTEEAPEGYIDYQAQLVQSYDSKPDTPFSEYSKEESMGAGTLRLADSTLPPIAKLKIKIKREIAAFSPDDMTVVTQYLLRLRSKVANEFERLITRGELPGFGLVSASKWLILDDGTVIDKTSKRAKKLGVTVQNVHASSVDAVDAEVAAAPPNTATPLKAARVKRVVRHAGKPHDAKDFEAVKHKTSADIAVAAHHDNTEMGTKRKRGEDDGILPTPKKKKQKKQKDLDTGRADAVVVEGESKPRRRRSAEAQPAPVRKRKKGTTNIAQAGNSVPPVPTNAGDHTSPPPTFDVADQGEYRESDSPLVSTESSTPSGILEPSPGKRRRQREGLPSVPVIFDAAARSTTTAPRKKKKEKTSTCHGGVSASANARGLAGVVDEKGTHEENTLKLKKRKRREHEGLQKEAKKVDGCVRRDRALVEETATVHEPNSPTEALSHADREILWISSPAGALDDGHESQSAGLSKTKKKKKKTRDGDHGEVAIVDQCAEFHVPNVSSEVAPDMIDLPGWKKTESIMKEYDAVPLTATDAAGYHLETVSGGGADQVIYSQTEESSLVTPLEPSTGVANPMTVATSHGPQAPLTTFLEMKFTTVETDQDYCLAPLPSPSPGIQERLLYILRSFGRIARDTDTHFMVPIHFIRRAVDLLQFSEEDANQAARNAVLDCGCFDAFLGWPTEMGVFRVDEESQVFIHGLPVLREQESNFRAMLRRNPQQHPHVSLAADSRFNVMPKTGEVQIIDHTSYPRMLPLSNSLGPSAGMYTSDSAMPETHAGPRAPNAHTGSAMPTRSRSAIPPTGAEMSMGSQASSETLASRQPSPSTPRGPKVPETVFHLLNPDVARNAATPRLVSHTRYCQQMAKVNLTEAVSYANAIRQQDGRDPHHIPVETSYPQFDHQLDRRWKHSRVPNGSYTGPDPQHFPPSAPQPLISRR